jgi:hypothetical protein
MSREASEPVAVRRRASEVTVLRTFGMILLVGGTLAGCASARHGGLVSETASIEAYRKVISARDELREDSPFPDWGKAEALMELAYAHVNATTPDVDAAEIEAAAALRLHPEWSYVRDVLLPQIEALRKRQGAEDAGAAD